MTAYAEFFLFSLVAQPAIYFMAMLTAAAFSKVIEADDD